MNDRSTSKYMQGLNRIVPRISGLLFLHQMLHQNNKESEKKPIFSLQSLDFKRSHNFFSFQC